MSAAFSLEQIREYWTKQAGHFGQAVEASWSDRSVVDLEIREISQYLTDGDRVLDAGCGNGYSTLEFARHRRIAISGRDFVPEMIKHAKLRSSRLSLRGTVDFDVDDITALHEPTDAYDKVVVIRVVINLGVWDRQLVALRECGRVLKRGGMLLLSEATIQGWSRLNQFRREWHLPDIPMPPFNNYVDQERLVREVADVFELVALRDFASTYYVGTRLLKPLLNQLLKGKVDVADPNLEWNNWFSRLPAYGDYGTQKLFVFRKR